MRNLYHAHQLLDEYTGDANGRADLMRRVRRVTEEFHELGGRADAEVVAREIGVGSGTVQRIADECAALSSAWPREADGAQMKLKRPPPDVRFTPKADIGTQSRNVRFVPILLQKSAVMDSW
jgi:hypothetical protein